MIGRTIGKYRIVGQLGRGGMGTVYRAVDETLEREVAIKVLNPELADSDVMKRFRAEATTLARLNHPEIATIYELFHSDDDLLMVMEFVRGETLDKLADRVGPFEPDRAAYLLDRVLAALEHAHRAGIVHRDMKPANVMVTAIGGVKIMDFGIARVRGDEHMTVDGNMMGTPAYMAPEQVLGQEVDGRADLYSVGVVFYRLLTGTLPFNADTAIGMVQKQISDAPTPLNMHRAGLPAWCEIILQRAMAKLPADRFQTAEEFRTTLARLAGIASVPNPALVDLETTPPQPITVRHNLLTPLPPQPITVTPINDASVTGTGSSLPSLSEVSAKAPGAPVSASAPAPSLAAPKPEGATIVLRRRHFAIAGSLVAALALAVALLAYVAFRRQPIVSAPPTAAVAPATSTTAPSDAAAPSESLASAPPAGAAPTVDPPVVRPAPAAKPINTPAPTAAGERGTAKTENRPVGAKPDEAAREPTAATAPASPVAPPRRTYQPLVFEARALIVNEDRSREVDAQVVFSDGRITVTDNDQPNPLHDVTYESVQSIHYSRGRDPMWSSPEGPAAVARASGGALGIFRGERHWLSLRTSDRFLVVRLENGTQIQRALAALQERTGKTAVTVTERKDAK